MRKSILIACVAVLGLGPAMASVSSTVFADEENGFGVNLDWDTAGYHIDVDAQKIGASTCELTIAGIAYSFPLGADNEFTPGADFASQYRNLTFPELSAAIDSDWLIILDKDLLTETRATIRIPDVHESDWDALPTITNPAPGAVDVPQDTSIDWTHDGPADEAHELVLEQVNGGAVYESDEFSDHSTTSWTPPSNLIAGEWRVMVEYFVDTGFVINGVADGFVDGVEGDPWILDNYDWFGFDSSGYSQFTVISDPTTPGDTNGDHIVNITDYANLVAQLGQAGDDLAADFNDDNIVDLTDFVILRRYFDSDVVGLAPEFVTETPEPATLTLLTLLALSLPKRGGLAILRRRRNC